MSNNEELLIFGKNIRQLRISHAMSLTSLAKQLHISIKTLKNLENGIIGKRLSVSILIPLCAIFHQPPHKFFQQTENEK